MTSATERLPQKSSFVSPASIAPGIVSMIALSTTSMIAMLTVSVASAMGMTAATVKPARSRGKLVSV